WTMPATGGEEKRLTTTGIYFGGNGQLPCDRLVNDYSWSPDSKTIVYCSSLSAEQSVWAVSLDTGARNKLSTDNGQDFYFSPLWSADGNRISFLSMTKKPSPGQTPITRVWIKEIGNDQRVIDERGSLVRLIGWQPISNELLIASDESTAG